MSVSINPADGRAFAHYDDHGPEEIEAALAGASRAQAAWGQVPITERVDLLRRIAAVLRAGSEPHGGGVMKD